MINLPQPTKDLIRKIIVDTEQNSEQVMQKDLEFSTEFETWGEAMLLYAEQQKEVLGQHAVLAIYDVQNLKSQYGLPTDLNFQTIIEEACYTGFIWGMMSATSLIQRAQEEGQ